MKNIKYSPQAKQDLLELKYNITLEFGENVALKTLKKITESIRSLSTYEMMGINISKKFGIPCDYRYFFSNKNYIFYRIEGNTIKIIRVLNERQDFIQTLFGIMTTSKETDEYWDE